MTGCAQPFCAASDWASLGVLPEPTTEWSLKLFMATYFPLKLLLWISVCIMFITPCLGKKTRKRSIPYKHGFCNCFLAFTVCPAIANLPVCSGQGLELARAVSLVSADCGVVGDPYCDVVYYGVNAWNENER